MRTRIPILALVLSLAACLPPPGDPPGRSETGLYPEIEPFETGRLKVSEIHELYYELSGNPEGIPVIGLHGGPGGSSSPWMRRLTDPSKFLVVLYDQRGAGKSTPSGDLRENDTGALVRDIDRLRDHLGLGKVVLFGGSWGTTLALAYAETHPENVSALVLRGVFTAARDEIDHFYHGGSAIHFPDAFADLLSALPDPERRPLPAYMLELIQGSEGEERLRYCRAWARYEATMATLQITDAFRERMKKWVEGEGVCTFSLFENHYMANGCFLEEGQLLKDAGRLAGIPTYIVQGRYDVICPPRTAWRLHRAIPGSTLVLADAAGHSGSEPETERALVGFFEAIGASKN